MSFVKNLGNNAIFSKVFRGGLRYYMILEKHPEFLQKTGYFPMWFFLKSLQNYRKFNYGKRVKEQLALPLLNSGRCDHRHRYNRHIAVTILVNASKTLFKGSYSDVRRSPHRMHSVSVRRGPHKKRLPNNQCSIAATGR